MQFVDCALLRIVIVKQCSQFYSNQDVFAPFLRTGCEQIYLLYTRCLGKLYITYVIRYNGAKHVMAFFLLNRVFLNKTRIHSHFQHVLWTLLRVCYEMEAFGHTAAFIKISLSQSSPICTCSEHFGPTSVFFPSAHVE